MIHLYINLGKKEFILHYKINCGLVNPKIKQRCITITHETVSKELVNFRDKIHHFTMSGFNKDMWIKINLKDEEIELAIADHIWKLLAQNDKAFHMVINVEHCHN